MGELAPEKQHPVTILMGHDGCPLRQVLGLLAMHLRLQRLSSVRPAMIAHSAADDDPSEAR